MNWIETSEPRQVTVRHKTATISCPEGEVRISGNVTDEPLITINVNWFRASMTVDEAIANAAELVIPKLEAMIRMLRPEPKPVEKRSEHCFFCKDEMPESVGAAIEEGWEPSFFHGGEEVLGPVCPECIGNHLELDDDESEIVTSADMTAEEMVRFGLETSIEAARQRVACRMEASRAVLAKQQDEEIF